MREPPPRTVLVGCSFAGLEFLYRYVRRRGRPGVGELTVVDRRAAHPYIPLAHEAMSDAASPEALRFDTRAFCHAVGAAFVEAEVIALAAERSAVVLAGGAELPYDRVILAVGSVPAVPAGFAADERVVPAKFVADALRLRDRVRVLHQSGVASPHVVVAGGGITGVEWAAELAGAGVDGRRVRVSIVERGERLLSTFAPTVARRATRVLGELGVRLHLGRSIASVAGDGVVLDDGARVPADVVLWAGGVRPAPVVAGLARAGLELTESGHLAVTPRLRVRGARTGPAYAIGDAVRIVAEGDPWPTMERAIEAIWQGALLGRRLAAGHTPDAGPSHRLRRTFFYGLSLGPRHSLVVYERFVFDARLNVWFRRWLKWAYYARFRLLARALGGRRWADMPTARAAANERGHQRG